MKNKVEKQKRNSSACFFSFTPVLDNLNKIFVVTGLPFCNKQMSDQYNVASWVYFSNKEITSNLTGFISGTLVVIFLNNVIFARTSPPRRRLFGRALSRPSTPNRLFDVRSQEARFGCTSGSVPEETHGDTGYDWKTTPSSKGNSDMFLFFSCFNC